MSEEQEVITTSEPIEGEYYPPMSIYIDENGQCLYKPVEYEKNLVQYKMDLIQFVDEKGRFTDKLQIKVSVDTSKLEIRDRWEILDL